MELSSQEGEIPIPINSSYGGGHGHGHLIHHEPSAVVVPHNHIIPSSAVAPPQIPTNGSSIPTSLDNKKVAVKYKECLKNHAATMGGTATDGCGEFMPSGEDGSIEALTCSACNCHRNFHRKEVEGEPSSSWDNNANSHLAPAHINRVGRKFLLGHAHHNSLLAPEALGYHHTAIPSRTAPPHHHQMIMSYNMGMGGSQMQSESDEQEDHGGGVVCRPPSQVLKKRFRTKFTQEQKEKMFNFAEKVGWKIQKQEESVVQNFCQEIGVRRRVLKVWMHNNKHNLAKKNPPPQLN